ncbi:unnamed protein product, partial [Timema podura]|nr:unnamed protein product [Timema podura]
MDFQDSIWICVCPNVLVGEIDTAISVFCLGIVDLWCSGVAAIRRITQGVRNQELDSIPAQALNGRGTVIGHVDVTELPLPLQCSCDVVAYQRWPSQMQSEHFPPGDDSVTQMSLDLCVVGQENVYMYHTCEQRQIIGFMISGLCGISIYWSRNTNVTIAVIATFLAASSVCGKALISVVVDLFPTSLRAMAVSMTMMFGRSGALLGNLMFPVLLDISCIIPFLLVSGIVIG